LNSADYCELSSEYSQLISNGFQEVNAKFLTDSIFFSKIIPDSIPDYWEYRTFISSKSIKKMPTYRKKYFFSKRKFISLNNECSDEVKYISDLFNKPAYLDTICSERGFFERGGRLDKIYDYVIYSKNNDIKLINTKESMISFIGDITTVQEAYFLCKLNGYECLFYKQNNDNHFEFIVNLRSIYRIDNSTVYKLEIIDNKITSRIRLCTSGYINSKTVILYD
jgi:hypothetical protein